MGVLVGGGGGGRGCGRVWGGVAGRGNRSPGTPFCATVGHSRDSSYDMYSVHRLLWEQQHLPPMSTLYDTCLPLIENPLEISYNG